MDNLNLSEKDYEDEIIRKYYFKGIRLKGREDEGSVRSLRSVDRIKAKLHGIELRRLSGELLE